MTSPRTVLWSSATIFSFKMKHPPGRRTSRILFKVCVARRPHARRVFDPVGEMEEAGPHERSVKNWIASTCQQRRSSREWTRRSGVVTFFTCRSGDLAKVASSSSHGSAPIWSRPKDGPMSLVPQKVHQLEIERSVTAALNRSVCVTTQFVMNPPYEPPATARRFESTNGYFEEAKSTASMRSR